MKVFTDSRKSSCYNHFMIKSFSENQREITDYFVQVEKKIVALQSSIIHIKRTSLIKIAAAFPKIDYNLMLKGLKQKILAMNFQYFGS